MIACDFQLHEFQRKMGLWNVKIDPFKKWAEPRLMHIVPKTYFWAEAVDMARGIANRVLIRPLVKKNSL